MYQEGDKSQAICSECGCIRTTTMCRRKMKTDTGVDVGELLVAVCDTCGKVIGIPQQPIPPENEMRDDAPPCWVAKLIALLFGAAIVYIVLLFARLMGC